MAAVRLSEGLWNPSLRRASSWRCSSGISSFMLLRPAMNHPGACLEATDMVDPCSANRTAATPDAFRSGVELRRVLKGLLGERLPVRPASNRDTVPIMNGHGRIQPSTSVIRPRAAWVRASRIFGASGRRSSRLLLRATRTTTAISKAATSC